MQQLKKLSTADPTYRASVAAATAAATEQPPLPIYDDFPSVAITVDNYFIGDPVIEVAEEIGCGVVGTTGRDRLPRSIPPHNLCKEKSNGSAKSVAARLLQKPVIAMKMPSVELLGYCQRQRRWVWWTGTRSKMVSPVSAAYSLPPATGWVACVRTWVGLTATVRYLDGDGDGADEWIDGGGGGAGGVGGKDSLRPG